MKYILVKRDRAFTIVELLVALLIAALGLAGVLRLFVESARSAHRSQMLAQAELLGEGVIAEWQTLSTEICFETLQAADGAYPADPEIFPETADTPRPISWQWQWEESLAIDQPLAVTLVISVKGDESSETIRIPAAL